MIDIESCEDDQTPKERLSLPYALPLHTEQIEPQTDTELQHEKVPRLSPSILSFW